MSRKFNPAILFEPWKYVPALAPYKSERAVLDAVQSRRKALMHTGMPLSYIAAGGEDFTKLLNRAFERDLAVVLYNRPSKVPADRWEPDIYVLHPDQAWRVSANNALWQTAFKDGSWSYSAEAQQSLLFGYTPKQRATWISWRRQSQAAYSCMTMYTLLTGEQRKLVSSLGSRCFGPANMLAGMNFFFTRKDDQIRKNATKLLPKGTVLARVGIDWKASQALFGHWKSWKSRMFINATVSENAAPKVNAGLRSNVQFLTARGWK